MGKAAPALENAGPYCIPYGMPKKMFLCRVKPNGQTFLYTNVSLDEKLKLVIFNHFCVILIKKLVEHSIYLKKIKPNQT